MKLNLWRYKWPIVIVLILIIIIAARLININKEPDVTESEQAVLVQKISSEKKETVLELSGSIEAGSSIVVSTKYGGKVAEIPVNNGTKVNRGQNLLLFDDVQQANAVKAAKSALTKAQANFSNLQKSFEQMIELQAAGAVSRDDLDKTKLALDIARADTGAAEAALANASDAYNDARIISDLDGFVAGLQIREGQVVGAGTPLMTVQDVSSVYVVVKVSQESISKIKKDLPAEITLNTDSQEKFEGMVDQVNTVADSMTRSFEVKIIVSNSDFILKPGMFVRTKIRIGSPVDVVAVPQTAVIGKEGMYQVFTVEGNTAKRQIVETGDIIGEKVEIRSGVQVGQQIIVSNVNKLKDGDLISISQQKGED